MKGIFFRACSTTNILKIVFNNINLKNYEWYNIQDQNESYEMPAYKNFLKSSHYSGVDFLKCVSTNHFIVFLKLQGYSESGKFKNINTLDDFNRSDCKLILLIYDCEYVEVYAKDDDIIQSIYNNVVNNKFSDVELLSDSDITRQCFSVL